MLQEQLPGALSGAGQYGTGSVIILAESDIGGNKALIFTTINLQASKYQQQLLRILDVTNPIPACTCKTIHLLNEPTTSTAVLCRVIGRRIYALFRSRYS